MCFMLYAGTINPLPRRDWDKDARNVSVKSLVEREIPIARYFSLPEIQYIGSTSGCGCDFPNVTLTKGDWAGYPEVAADDLELEACERINREALVTLLKASGGKVVELYGIWLSDNNDFAKPVNVREEIPLAKILEPAFRFKERGFYQVSL